MARSTFDGPILSGDNRFGPFRNIGYATLAQSAYLDFTNTAPNTAGYAGASGRFANSNNIPNGPAVVYIPSATTPFANASAQTIPADSSSQIYRGWVCYLPTGSTIDTWFIDVAAVPTTAAGTISTIKVYVSNNYTVEGGTPTYGSVSSVSAVGRQSLATFTATQITNQSSTSTDLVGVNPNTNLSQVVFTVSMAGTSMTTLNAGKFYFSIQYVQPDGNIGTATAYPYGNFD